MNTTMENKMGKTEIDVKSIRAHSSGVIGCVRHNKDIMISYNSNNVEKDSDDIIDLFLTQEQAEDFLAELSQRVKANKEGNS